AQSAHAADLLLHKGDKWHGYNTSLPSALNSLVNVLKPKFGDQPLHNRLIAIVGLTAAAKSLAQELQRAGAGVILTSHQKKAGLEAAQALSCRYVQFEALYSTIHDVLIICDQEKTETPGRPGATGVHPGYLKPGMTVLDLTMGTSDSE